MKRKTAYMGLFLALALICSYIETLIPLPVGIPGVKLGLANLVTVLLLYSIGAKEAFWISVLRILLSGFLFGNAFGILYSLSGALFSFLVMLLVKKTGRLGCVSVSTAGGIFHNIGQLGMAVLVAGNAAVLYYFPVLLAAGALTGFVIGILAQEIIIRIGGRIHF